jgi:hypothetical protein
MSPLAVRSTLAPVLCAVLVATTLAMPAAAVCEGDWLVDPDAMGSDSESFVANFYTLLNDLTHEPTGPDDHVALDWMTIDGETFLTVPWFASSTECTEALLKKDIGGAVLVEEPSLDQGTAHYLMVTDELSELAWAVSLGMDELLMDQLDRTVHAMESAEYAGLPCWVAEVEEAAEAPITCISEDTATDGTVRLGLAYYNAANNQHFSAAGRTYFRARGDAIAERHVELEYRHEIHTSGVTGTTMSHWVAGGANTAKPGNGFEMFVGYYADVALFLFAAHVSTGDPVYLDRADDVVDQFLAANSFDGTILTFGPMKFAWVADGAGDLVAQEIKAWEDADAPRALWIGHVLRARDMALNGAALTYPYTDLSTWVQLLLATDTQTPTHSCIQYAPDGTATNCGNDFYYHGLSMGLVTFENLSWLQTKLEDTLVKYAWGEAGQYWNWTDCFGIYRPIRPVKALASALGLDAATYGGRRPRACLLDVVRTGSGSGWVESERAGIDCGAHCTSLFRESEEVSLFTLPYQGSSFTGWVEAACANHPLVVAADTTCTAEFDGTCDPVANFQAQVVDQPKDFAGCDEVRAGNGFRVVTGGEAMFVAGGRIVLYDGFSVESGGTFVARAGVEP